MSSLTYTINGQQEIFKNTAQVIRHATSTIYATGSVDWISKKDLHKLLLQQEFFIVLRKGRLTPLNTHKVENSKDFEFIFYQPLKFLWYGYKEGYIVFDHISIQDEVLRDIIPIALDDSKEKFLKLMEYLYGEQND